MGKVKLYFKYSIRNRIVASLAVVVLGYVLSSIVGAVTSDANGSIVELGNYSVQLANITNAAYLYISLFFLLAVYFTFSIKNSNLDELQYGLYSGSRNFHIVSLNILNVICVAIYVIVHLIIAGTRFNMDAVFAAYIIKRFVLCYLLPAVLSIFLGCVVGRINNMMLLWGVCIGVLLVYSPFAMSLYERNTEFNSIWRTIGYNFDIIQNNVSGTSGFDTDSTYLYKWMKIIGLIAAAATLYLIVYKRKIVKYIGAFLIALFVICEIYYYIPDSKVLDKENWCSNNSYYTNNRVQLKESDAEFAVTDYKMDINFGKTLEVECTVTVDNPKLDELDFTLYHTLDVVSVTDSDGENVEYKRDGDYLTVNNKKHSDAFRIIYKGKTEFYISNDRYIYLPQNYAYYPLSGFKDVNKNGGYLQAKNDYEADFDVTLNIKDVYTNLKKDENNHYVGKTVGPLFVKGDLQEISVDEYKFVVLRYMPDAALADTKALTEIADYFKVLEKQNDNYNFRDKNIYILYYSGGVVCADTYNNDYVDLPSANIESIKRIFSRIAD